MIWGVPPFNIYPCKLGKLKSPTAPQNAQCFPVRPPADPGPSGGRGPFMHNGRSIRHYTAASLIKHNKADSGPAANDSKLIADSY